MRLNEEEYKHRLEAYTDDTLRLILEINSMDKGLADQADKITSESELTESEVVAKLNELKRSYLTTTETK